ncbi:MAG TPA: asparagine synthase (glutamine-hydrolyzing) [Flavitalea sp.]|nr:asparagine synthase (glutamine-hydrolyzing) [Flavitalea sp.]
MCGLAAIVYFKNNLAEPETIRKMTDCMSHRGPDSDGFFVEENIALGHRRLSIIDLSEVANQPIEDATGRYQLLFNGEIFNFREVRKLLPDYPFKTQSDSEVLLAAYIKWGPDCLPLIKGMFVFMIWDRQKKSLFIARDRLGVKPLYYYFDEERFVCASEIRSILKTGWVAAKINMSAVRSFLSYQSIGFPFSIIQNILQLEAGCYMTIDNGRVTQTKYWSVTDSTGEFEYNNRKKVNTRIRELLREAVAGRMISDVPLGAFLSGGIDSSAIVGLMAEVSSAPVNTFTIGFHEKDFDESGYADLIAKKFNTSHNSLLLHPEVFLEELTNALNNMDTPSGDGVNTYVVSKAIRKSGLTVALSGVGGDELFAGYPFFKKFMEFRQYNAIWDRTSWVRKGAAALVSVGSSNKADRFSRMLSAASCSIAYAYPEFRRIISPQLLASLTKFNTRSLTVLEQQLRDRENEFEKFPLLSQVSIAEYLGYTQHTLLKDTDQMSMAVSLEVREPFFDHELIEFVLGIPDHIKYPRYPKSLLVDALDGLLPDEIVHRKKQGFLFPWSLWMKNELKSFVQHHINRISQRDFIRGENLRAHWQQFLKGNPKVGWMEIWLFVILEYWLEKNEIS